MFEISLSNNATKFYQQADEKLSTNLNNAFDELSLNPYFGNNIKMLKGKLFGLYRYRLGNYRIVYSVEETIKVIAVIWIGKRKDAY